MASTTDNTNCAACGKEGGNLNTCNKCNMVKYCNAACKKKHRSKHKKQCEKRVAELHDVELFKEHPPTDDCPICFLPLPLDITQKSFKSCCGKVICFGCIYAMYEEARGRGKINLCAFCRVPYPSSDEEQVKRIEKLMEVNNADAFYRLGGYYYDGSMGMSQDWSKADKLFLKAGELGCAEAYNALGNSYYHGMGAEMDKKKATHYLELAAMNGSLDARYILGCVELVAGNFHQAKKHFLLAARAGFKPSLEKIKAGFQMGYITKDEYANALRAFQSRQDEMKSDQRDKAEAIIQTSAFQAL